MTFIQHLISHQGFSNYWEFCY